MIFLISHLGEIKVIVLERERERESNYWIIIIRVLIKEISM